METDYEVLGRLGEGSFGKVYKARHRRTGEEVAVKQIKLGARSWEEACRSTELQALKALRHPFIVRLRELIRSSWDGSLYYIFEFLDSDLCRLLKEHTSGLEELRCAALVRQLFTGLAHMHQHNFFHRDMKPENVLLDAASETIRIADLGQARSLRARPPFTDYVGTRWYRAPECLLRDRSYSSPVDIWAGGLIFAELLRGSPLFCGTSTIDQLYKIFQVLHHPTTDWPDLVRLAQAVRFRVPDRNGCGVIRCVPPTATPQVHGVLTEILELNPRRRPTARKLLDHSFFSTLPPLSLDVDRLDTHRSRASSHVAMPEGTEEEKLDEYPGVDDTPASGAEATVAVPDDVDLDAELDAILGEGGGGSCAARGAAELRPPSREGSDVSSRNDSPRGGLEGPGLVFGQDSGSGDSDANGLSAAPVAAKASGLARLPRLPIGSAGLGEETATGAASKSATPKVTIAPGATSPSSASEQPRVSREGSGGFDFAPTARSTRELPECGRGRPDSAPDSAKGSGGMSAPPPPSTTASLASASVDALLESLCADFDEQPTTKSEASDASDTPQLVDSAADPAGTVGPLPAVAKEAITANPQEPLAVLAQARQASEVPAPAEPPVVSSDVAAAAESGAVGQTELEALRAENLKLRELLAGGSKEDLAAEASGVEAPPVVGQENLTAPVSTAETPPSAGQENLAAAVSSAETPLGVGQESATGSSLVAGSSTACEAASTATVAKAQPWSLDEAAQLRRVVKRVIRRGVRDKNALWTEVSSELGGNRTAEDCKKKYKRDYYTHKAKTAEACRAELAACEVTTGEVFRKCDEALVDSFGDAQRHLQMKSVSVAEPLFHQGVAMSQTPA